MDVPADFTKPSRFQYKAMFMWRCLYLPTFWLQLVEVPKLHVTNCARPPRLHNRVLCLTTLFAQVTAVEHADIIAKLSTTSDGPLQYRMIPIMARLPVPVAMTGRMTCAAAISDLFKDEEEDDAPYSEIARRLNALLQYLEVNLTAVRKILKKFDKKVPAEFRVRKTQDYKGHHELFMTSMQYVLVTAVQMQRLIAERVADSEPLAVPVSQLGPESLAVLALTPGPAGVGDVLGRVPATRIDVYAKPAGVGAAEPPTPIPAKPQAKPVPSVLPRRQQARGAAAAAMAACGAASAWTAALLMLEAEERGANKGALIN
eukprot:s5392_g2.t1